MKAESVWIVGGGRFGARAAGLLRDRFASSGRMRVIDREAEALEAVRPSGATLVQADATDYLVRHLSPENRPAWIVPCVPFHLAWRWLLARPGISAAPLDVPADVAAGLPHPMPSGGGGWFASHADFLCPPDCPEPGDHCTHTGRPRPGDLFTLMAALNLPGLRVRVIRSHQLAPGLGGYAPQKLFELEQDFLSAPAPMLVGTACRCHGVIHGIQPR